MDWRSLCCCFRGEDVVLVIAMLPPLDEDSRKLISRRTFSKAILSGKAKVYDFVDPVVMALSNDFGCDAGLT